MEDMCLKDEIAKINELGLSLSKVCGDSEVSRLPIEQKVILKEIIIEGLKGLHPDIVLPVVSKGFASIDELKYEKN